MFNKVYIVTEDDQEYGYRCLSFDNSQHITKQVFFNKTDAENEAARLYEEYLKEHPYYLRNQPKEYKEYVETHPFGHFYVDERTVY